MKKFEAYAGSAVWMAVSLLMTAAALEPVEARTPGAEREPCAEATAAALCADGSVQLAMGCASVHL